jgi:type II secretory pathway pseudopilin PulG
MAVATRAPLRCKLHPTRQSSESASLHSKSPRAFFFCAAVVVLFLTASPAVAQSTTVTATVPSSPQDVQNNPALLRALGELFQKMQQSVRFPPERGSSRLLARLPESTIFYAALPNYGEASHQALTVFREELAQNADLRGVWQHVELSAGGPKLEDYLERFYQFSQYLGDEIVASVSVDTKKEPGILILAETRKPGLREFLVQATKELGGKSPIGIRIYDPQELAAAKETPGANKFSILVRPDFVIGAADVATLQRFSAQLDGNSQNFASTPFGQRVARAYEGGATIVSAIDVQTLLSLAPVSSKQDLATLQRTGFTDAKYLVWRHRSSPGQTASETELSFTGPRRGVAAWLAAPGPLGSLDFLSPDAMMATGVLLKNPADIFDDISDLANASNPNSLAAITQMEQGLKVSLRSDLLAQLTGEIAVELDTPGATATPAWKAALRVKDPQRLQTTLSTIFTAMHWNAQRHDDGDLTYHTVEIPSAQKTLEIGYTFVDGYLVIGSSREATAEAVRLHRTGGSLAKFEKFQAALPPPPLSEASAVFYEDPSAWLAFNLRQAPPAIAGLFSQVSLEKSPIVLCAYGEETALRQVSTSGGVDVAGVMIVAAIAIPNLMRAREAANEASAVGEVRTVNTAQITYAATYPQRGFARDLATLGSDPAQINRYSVEHAGILDAALAGPDCSAEKWCEKSGYRFSVSSLCKLQHCSEYVVTATPVSTNTGTRNFCSTSADAVIRFKTGAPLTTPLTIRECKSWSPLQ